MQQSRLTTAARSEASGQYRITAAILSAVAMGLGQLYNRQWIKGFLLLIIDVAALSYFVRNLGHALWGLFTLGKVPTHFETVNGIAKTVVGDHSIYLMIEGLITVFALLIFAAFYVLNIRDAYWTGALRERGRIAPGFGGTLANVADKQFPYLLLTIPTVGVLFLTVLPIVFMILIAFTNFSSPQHIPPAKLVNWVGFQTFLDLVQLKTWKNTFIGVFQWTIIWAVIATVTTYFGGLLVALLIQQSGIRFKGFWRTVFILPYAIPQIISLLVMRNLFNGQFGPINQYLAYFGLGKLPWLTDPLWAKVTVIVVNMWVGIPVSMVLIMGVLTTIPRDYYEAAEVDGASGFQKFRIITLPMVLFSTAPILIMQFAGNINNFNVIFLLTNGDPVNGGYQFAGSTDLLVTWLFKLTQNQNKYNMASAVGIIIFLIVASFSIWSYRQSKSYKEEDLVQ